MAQASVTAEEAVLEDASPRTGKKRVLVLASTFPRWQDDTEPPFVYNLCRSLQNDFEITVLAPHTAGAARCERWEQMEVRRFQYVWPERWQRLAYGGILPNLKRNRWLWLQVPLFFAAEFIAALRIIREERPDVIHAHWLVPQGVVGALLAVVTGNSVALTAHGGDIYGLQGKVATALKRWALGRMTRVTAVSQDLADAIRHLRPGPPINIDIISMGVDSSRFAAVTPDKELKRELCIDGPMLLFVGRLAEKKGLRFLLEALPAVLAKQPAATLVVVGDGPLRGELEQLAGALMVAKQVRFVGAKRPDELPAYYAAADVFVGPSIVADGGDTESFGVVFAEAMASGCPVVASDVGGVRDLVRDGETGLLVTQRDAQAVACAVSRILEDRELRRRLVENGRDLACSQYDQKVVAARYLEILEGVAA